MHPTSSPSMSTRISEVDHGTMADRILQRSVPVVKRFILSGVFFVILNIWYILQALKNGFFRSSYKVDYAPVSREDSFTRGSNRKSYQTAIYNGYPKNKRLNRTCDTAEIYKKSINNDYRKNKRSQGNSSWQSSKASTSEIYDDSGYSAYKFDPWTDTSASEKRFSDSSVQTTSWWKNELDGPQPLRSDNTTADTRIVDSEGTTSDNDEVFFVPRSRRNSRSSTKKTNPISNCRLHAERDAVLDISKSLTVNHPNQGTSQNKPSETYHREIRIDAVHIHATSVNMGVERVKTLLSNSGPSPYYCMNVQQDIAQSDGAVYGANMSWV